MRWVDGIMDSIDMSLSTLKEIVKGRFLNQFVPANNKLLPMRS